MWELTETLLGDIPSSLEWVKGIFLIIEGIALFGMLLSPLIMIFSLARKRRTF